MRDVQEQVRRRLESIERIKERDATAALRYKIVPKIFTVDGSFNHGTDLRFEKGEIKSFEGPALGERTFGRVFFLPEPFYDQRGTQRYLEVKGYGSVGRDICLWSHEEGDILNGMFYQNAKKEYKRLEQAFLTGLKVPAPVFYGKISKEEWLKSGLKVVDWLSEDSSPWPEIATSNLTLLSKEITTRMHKRRWVEIEDFLSAFSQSDTAGVLGRAPITPLRVGDPCDNYELNEENTSVARECGKTFWKLIDLGYLHLCPSTGNWTEAGELTDLVDCYDLKKDKDLVEIAKVREARWKQGFWQNLIGPFHTSNLSPVFIEGMFGQKMELHDAANELKKKVVEKVEELRN